MRASLILSLLVAVIGVLGVHAASGPASGERLEVSTGLLRPSPSLLLHWLERGSDGKNAGDLPPIDLTLSRQEVFTQMRVAFIQRAEIEARTLLGGGDPTNWQPKPPEQVADDEYPYWQFVPDFHGGSTPSTPLKWTAACFQANSAVLTATGNTTFTLSINSAQPSNASGCSDFYLFATIDGLAFQTISAAGTVTLNWSLPADATESHVWDLQAKGIRVFEFAGGAWEMLESVVNTLLLFEPQLTPGVSPAAAARNVDFLAKYAGFQMTPRNTTSVFVPEEQIQSGDFFGVMRLDGLDPMLGWAMGSTTGHATTALWIGGQLYVCESTVKGSHWPVNGVQKTPYRTWLAQVQAAGQNAVHAPLTPEARARFNETAAVEWFLTVEGLNYGYHTLLWGWLDTPENNYPCLPPDFKRCLGWPFFEVVFGLLDRFAPATGDLLFNEAFNLRLGTQGLKAADLFYEAARQGYAPDQLPTIVEQDDWLYNTTRYGVVEQGRSMVCCVFVCNVWKNAGVFSNIDNEVQCGELTNWDDYALDILYAPPRPSQCVSADPSNPLCQLEGAWTLELNDYATKTPYANMAQQCPSQGPDYQKPANC